MSKLMQCLFDCFIPAMPPRQPLLDETDLALEAKRIYQASADQMRYQRKGFTQDYKTTHQALTAQVAARVTSELAKFDLTHPGLFAVIQQALIRWKPSTGEYAQECQTVKQALLSCLPAARQTQQLRALCRDYKGHLALDIESQLYADHYDLYWQYQTSRHAATPGSQPATPMLPASQAAHSLDHFVATHLKSNALLDNALKKTVIKYEAVTALEKTLQTPQSAVVQVQNFQQTFQQQKPALEKHRDSWTTRFFKGIATILTLGAAACFGIFGVKGAGVAQNMQNVLAAPSPTVSAGG